MKKALQFLIITIALAVLSNLSSAQVPNCQWADAAIGAGFNYGKSIATDLNGDVIITGYFNSNSITFGSFTLTKSNGYDDVFVAKYDANGNVIWAKSAGGTDNDYGFGITTDINGNIFVIGSFYSDSITFDSITLTNSGFTKIFIVKYDSAGKVLWAKAEGSIHEIIGSAITTDSSGNVLITGYYSDPSITFGTITLTNTSQSFDEIFVVKYDTAGNVLWAKSAGGTSTDRGLAIATDANKNVFVTGAFSSLSFIIDTTILYGIGSNDIYVLKYDSAGNLVWANSAGGTHIDIGYGIATDATGNVLICGSFKSPSITFGSTTLSNASTTPTSDLFLVKYSVNGNVIWAKSVGGASFDDCAGICTDASQNVYITGYFKSDSINFGSTTLIRAGASNFTDLYIVKYDAIGNAIWATKAGGTDNDFGDGIATDVNENVLITGNFASLSIAFGSTTITKALPGGQEVFVAKLGGFTGINEFNNEDGFTIYPNPGNGVFTIETSVIKNAELFIYNLTGEILFSQKLNSGKHTICAPSLSSGIYFIKVTDSERFYTKKLLVQ